MQGALLRLYVPEGQRHDGKLLWQWLLESANDMGVRGGSAFKAMAGFGQRHVMREATFFELAGSLAVEVQFVVSQDEAKQLLQLLTAAQLKLFYSLTPAEIGVT